MSIYWQALATVQWSFKLLLIKQTSTIDVLPLKRIYQSSLEVEQCDIVVNALMSLNTLVCQFIGMVSADETPVFSHG